MWLTPLALVLLQCTSITSKTGYQCQSTDDCSRRGAEFASTTCKDGICQDIVGKTPPSTVCASNRDCLGGTLRCVKGECLEYPCDVRGDVVDEEGVLLGVLRPSTPESVGVDVTQALPALLGLLADQWNLNADDLKEDGVPHVGLLMCDEGKIEEAADHFEKLGVKAIVGPLTEPALVALRNTLKTKIPILSPTGDSPRFKEAFGADQPWFCSSNLADAVGDFADLIKKVAAATAVDRGRPPTVAFVHNSWSDGETTFFNRTKAALPVDLAVSELDVNTDLTKAGRPNLLQASNLARVSKPDIVVMTGAAWARAFVNDLELRWPASSTRPVYVVMRTVPQLNDTLKARNWPRKVYALDVAREGKLQANYGAMLGVLAGYITGQGSVIPTAGAAYNDCLLTALYGTFKAQTANNVSPSSLGAEQITSGIASAGAMGSGQINLTTLPSDIGTAVGLLRTASSQTQMTGANAIYGFESNTHVPIGEVTPYCLSADLGSRTDTWRRVEFTEGSGAPSCP
ncbi:MAG: hypothetical protein KIT84_02995 [Labilithrix sp.]|nr:hypothetical protein [Labilithrix sp.]MCW5809949.1 hypothetical protein [Labilithrix sp.]